MRALVTTSLLVLFVLTSGCADELPPGSEVRWDQPLGFRLEVEGDPTRSSPAPGETLNIRVEQAFPEAQLPLSYAFIGCNSAAVSFGTPICASEPVLLVAELTPVAGTPSFTWTLPDAAALDGVHELLIIGVQCSGGPIEVPDLSSPASLDPDDLVHPCVDPEGEGTSMYTRVLVESATFTNQNPAFESVILAGSILDEVAPPSALPTGCRGLGLRLISAAGTRLISGADTGGSLPFILSATPGSREDYILEVGDPPEQMPKTEDLRITHLTTGAEMERTFSSIDDASPFIEVSWELPAEIPDEGALVRFFFEMRDLRGGYDYEQRAVCVVP